MNTYFFDYEPGDRVKNPKAPEAKKVFNGMETLKKATKVTRLTWGWRDPEPGYPKYTDRCGQKGTSRGTRRSWRSVP